MTGGSFSATGIPIREGFNIITAEARDPFGNPGTSSVRVILDTNAPRINITSPTTGLVTSNSLLTVSGNIHDLVSGTINSDQAQVTVNGIQATISNRTFIAEGVPLNNGQNTVTATVTDMVGNTATDSIDVTLDQSPNNRINLVSGNNQSASIGQLLPDPLVVSLTDSAGNPVPNQPVIFRVKENNGQILNGNGPYQRSLIVNTDAQGHAQVNYFVGTRAGAGNNKVLTTASGFIGAVTFTASGTANPPSKINLDSGNNQKGAVGQPLPKPFVAIVTDEGHNRLANIPVTFSVNEGGGDFNNESSITVNTDSDGRAFAVLSLGPESGFDNNVVKASVPNLSGLPATFVASGLVPGDPAQTKITGVVLDNTDLPIQGVTMEVQGTGLEVQTDAQGQFELLGVPVGDVLLIADGTTAHRPGTWPTLEYELDTVTGQNNTVGMPIYLLPLDVPDGIFVDETTGGTLTIPEIPGFSLEIEPGSATFPDGSKSGVVSATVVHNDKVPMTPNFGQQPRFVVTIQPAGVQFDPPAPVTFPNVDGLVPGKITEFYSFDHDAGSFVPIGTGTVSEDGTVIESDPGVGIVKGGWHCGGDPNVPGSGEPANVSISAPETTEIVIGKDITVTAEGGPTPGDFTWYVCEKNGDGSANCENEGSSTIVSIGESTTEEIEDEDRGVSTVKINGLSLGTETIAVKFTCENGHEAIDQIQVTVVPEVILLTVIGNATQDHVIQNPEGPPNWAAVQGAGDVLLEVTLNPNTDEAAQYVNWSVGTAVDNLPRQRKVSKSTSMHIPVIASAGESSARVDLWILYAILELRISGQKSPGNDKFFPIGSGADNLGPHSDEVDFITIAEAIGKVEIVATLSPPGVHEIVKTKWDIHRVKTLRDFENGISILSENNEPDDSDPLLKDLLPDSDDKIYDIDSPSLGLNFLANPINHTKETYNNFRQWVTWDGQVASDNLFWYYIARIDDDLDVENKPANADTIINDVFEGQITIPQEAFFPTR